MAKQEYVITVMRVYSVIDEIRITDATSKENAKQKALKISANKDYTSQLTCDEAIVIDDEKIK